MTSILDERPGEIKLRETVRPADVSSVRALVLATGFFQADEVVIATDLVQERLAHGTASGYEFVFVDCGDRMLGYACYGPIPCSSVSWDLYWIVVDPEVQGARIGHHILTTVEKRVRVARGITLYAETSGTALYHSTRVFYRRNGFAEKAVFRDFYDRGDDKVVFAKRVSH